LITGIVEQNNKTEMF